MVLEGDGQGLFGDQAPAARGGSGVGGERILVAVRLRPLNAREIARGENCDWECINDKTIIYRSAIPDRPMSPTAYTFDRVFHGDCSTRKVYEEASKEVVLSVLSGINASIFAYGQTSSGKTYTMMGVIELAMADIFDYIKKHEERTFVMKFSGMEIYNESVKDLLCPEENYLRITDDPERGTVVEDLTAVIVSHWNDFKKLISICEVHRKIGETALNEASSRSHQIIRLTIESSAVEFVGKDNSSTLVASVNFVDLAGSERASQALSTCVRLKEGCHINRSLLTLATVIRKLSCSKGRHSHIPYRDSKLTRILKPALDGNSRTAFICTLCPGESHIEQTRNTLLFASSAKEVTTSAQVNVIMSDRAFVNHLQKEVERLEIELKRSSALAPRIKCLETLLREKDDQIYKKDNKIAELINQRDLAESQLQDLRRNAKEDHKERSVTSLGGYASVGTNKSNLQVPEKHEEQNHSPGSSISGQKINDLFANVFCMGLEDFDDSCREVKCIEMDDLSMTGSRDLDPLLSEESELKSLSVDQESQYLVSLPDEIADPSHDSPESTIITLNQQLMNARKIFDNPGKMRDESSMRYFPGSREFAFSRSRSCRAVLMNGFASPWCYKPDHTDGFAPGRSSDISRTHAGVHFVVETKPIPGLKEIARKQYSNKFINNQEPELDNNEGCYKTSGNVGLFPSSPSRWHIEFQKKRQEIIELWHTCLVPIIHRTYFFLLFNGDPEDSIYVEVELRRLHYLKASLLQKDGGKALVMEGNFITFESSARDLQRERLMLTKKMHGMEISEREKLYHRWRIPLCSKQRKSQLVQMLWTKTKNIEHVMDSASVVAKVVGLLEPDKAPKEMFGLSFGASKTNNRWSSSFRWRIQQGIASFF